jgi:hypothetical protein
MILEIHPKSKKITIELSEEYIDQDVKIIVKPKKKSLRGRLKIEYPKDENNAWLKWIKKKYEKN